MGDAALDSYPDTPLKLAMLQRRVSIRELARRLDGAADQKRMDNLRQQIRGWLNGAQPQVDNALRLAAALELPDDYFVKAKTPQQSVREELAELRRRVDEVEAEIRERLARLPQDRSASERQS